MQVPHRPIPESYWVEPDRILAGEYPGNLHTETTRRRVDKFLEAGITTFIDLTEPNELVSYEAILKERARAYGLNVTYQRFEIADYETPSQEKMTHILDTIDNTIASGQKVYIHCWAGVGRTGTTVGCYLVRKGRTGDEALEQIAEWWQDMPKRVHHPTSPETEGQCDYIRNWREIPTPARINRQNYCEG